MEETNKMTANNSGATVASFGLIRVYYRIRLENSKLVAKITNKISDNCRRLKKIKLTENSENTKAMKENERMYREHMNLPQQDSAYLYQLYASYINMVDRERDLFRERVLLEEENEQLFRERVLLEEENEQLYQCLNELLEGTSKASIDSAGDHVPSMAHETGAKATDGAENPKSSAPSPNPSTLPANMRGLDRTPQEIAAFRDGEELRVKLAMGKTSKQAGLASTAEDIERGMNRLFLSFRGKFCGNHEGLTKETFMMLLRAGLCYRPPATGMDASAAPPTDASASAAATATANGAGHSYELTAIPEPHTNAKPL